MTDYSRRCRICQDPFRGTVFPYPKNPVSRSGTRVGRDPRRPDVDGRNHTCPSPVLTALVSPS